MADEHTPETPEPEQLGYAEIRDSAPGRPVAVLWIPDIDARHRWREFAIYPEPPAPRPLGFRGPARAGT